MFQLYFRLSCGKKKKKIEGLTEKWKLEKLVRISPFFFLLFEIISNEFLLINFQHLIFRIYLSFIFLHKNCANFFPFTKILSRKIFLEKSYSIIEQSYDFSHLETVFNKFHYVKKKRKKKRIEFAKFFTNYIFYIKKTRRFAPKFFFLAKFYLKLFLSFFARL